jgi:hypothetical protein
LAALKLVKDPELRLCLVNLYSKAHLSMFGTLLYERAQGKPVTQQLAVTQMLNAVKRAVQQQVAPCVTMFVE